MKKILSVLLALVMAVQPFSAQAVDLSQAFTDLVGPGAAATASGPGRFSSASRTGVTLGGFEMRSPRASVPTLLNASAPKITAGCNGISAHFGGFSFISGSEFTDLMKNIASGAAMGFVASLVMKSLCPMCEAVVQELKSAAQAAARLAKDSCALGEQFARSYFSGEDTTGAGIQNCEKVVAESGTSPDTLSAGGDLCKNLRAASKSLNEWADSVGADKSEVNACNGIGNKTWAQLGSLEFSQSDTESYKRKLMLINLMGAELAVKDGATVSCALADGSTLTAGGAAAGGGSTPAGDQSRFCPPMLTDRDLTGMFMCGAPGAPLPHGTSDRVATYCNTFAVGSAGGAAGKSIAMWACNEPKDCDQLVKVDATEAVVGKGLLLQISELLGEAVKRVREGTQGFDDPRGKQILALVNAVPVPLYQAINAAAVYPAAGADIIDSMSVVIAEQFSHALLNEVLREAGRGGAGMCISRAQANEIVDFLGSLRSRSASNLELIGQQFALQQGLSEQIRSINTAIARQVLSQDMLASGQVTEALNRAITPTGNRASAP